MSEWVYFVHPPRDNFATTLTADEAAAFNEHFEWLDGLYQEGVLIMVGASGGTVNTGICVFEAPDEETARDVVAKDPVAGGGHAPGELRPFNLGLLRGGMGDSEQVNQT